MNRLLLAGILLLTILAAGCAGSPQSSTMTAINFGTPKNIVQTVGYAGPSTYLAPLPTAFILLNQAAVERNQEFCDAFRSVPSTPSITTSQTSAIRQNIVETDYLMTDDRLSTPGNCQQILGDYDYARAKTYLAALNGAASKEGNSININGQGPFVVIVLAGVYRGGGTIVVDASNQSDMDKFVGAYQQKILDVGQSLDQFSNANVVASPTPETTAATTPPAGSSNGASGNKKWYSGIFGIISNIIESIWPITKPVITVIKAIICG